jgi:topoisomerase-4 subunit A
VAMALLDVIDEDAVDLRPTYDGSESEPVVLPSAFPNLLANGSAGIAVGMATSIPPHNAGELLAALSWMAGRPIGSRRPEPEELLKHVRGPDLPTGGVILDGEAAILDAYRTGRGSFRLRAHYEVERLGHGQYQVVVTEVAYQVPKSRLIERIAELLNQKKLPFLADVRDESAEEIRLVLIPRSRSVTPEVLMEQLFRATDLEVRLPLNMNVLDAQGVPRVMGLGEVLEAYLAHRMEVLVRRSRHRLAKVEDRLEVLEGYLKAFLDLDEVIRIIREEDEPRPALMRRFELTERQAEAILNLRLRNLRKLEEMELARERDALLAERAEIEGLLGDEGRRRARLREEFQAAKKQFGNGALGKRRTRFAAAPAIEASALEEPVERYPVTIVCSQKGWIRAVRGAVENPDEIKYKEGDAARYLVPAQSADKLLLVASDGRVFAVPVDKLPGGRGQGEPLSILVDLAKGADIVALRVHRPEGRLLLATRDAFGFVAPEAEIAAQTKAGKQVVNLAGDDRVTAVLPADGDHVAVVGTNRKLLVFPLAELPEQARGKGVTLQRYQDGRLGDVTTVELAKGLTFTNGGGKPRTVADLRPWLGRRGQAGKLAPHGFPRDNRFR